MTRSVRSAVLVVAGLVILLPAPVRAQKLDNDLEGAKGSVVSTFAIQP